MSWCVCAHPSSGVSGQRADREKPSYPQESAECASVHRWPWIFRCNWGRMGGTPQHEKGSAWGDLHTPLLARSPCPVNGQVVVISASPSPPPSLQGGVSRNHQELDVGLCIFLQADLQVSVLQQILQAWGLRKACFPGVQRSVQAWGSRPGDLGAEAVAFPLSSLPLSVHEVYSITLQILTLSAVIVSLDFHPNKVDRD